MRARVYTHSHKQLRAHLISNSGGLLPERRNKLSKRFESEVDSHVEERSGRVNSVSVSVEEAAMEQGLG